MFRMVDWVIDGRVFMLSCPVLCRAVPYCTVLREKINTGLLVLRPR